MYDIRVSIYEIINGYEVRSELIYQSQIVFIFRSSTNYTFSHTLAHADLVSVMDLITWPCPYFTHPLPHPCDDSPRIFRMFK